MKRLLVLFIIVCITASTFALPVSAAAADDSGLYALLGEFKIMSGDPDGNLRLDDYVSRAEFTKIAVASSSFKNSVATNLAVSPFPDVTYKHWAAPYVRVGVSNGIVSGYPDATFKPDGTVRFEEAVTMMLRVLGYSDSDFGTSWPSGQIGLANNLDMTDGLGCNVGDSMNRRQVAQLVYNTLKTKMKGQQSRLISVFDAQITEDTTVVASSMEDSAIASDEVVTTSGTYKISESFDKGCVGKRGDIIVKNGNKLVALVTDNTAGDAEEYVVYSVLDNKVMAYKDGSVRQIEIDDGTTAYKGKSQMNFSALKSQIELGDRLMVRMNERGEVDYVTYGKGNVRGPVTSVSGSWERSLNVTDGAKVIRNGVNASETAIQNYDVVYYLQDLGLVLAYNNKVTGIYEKATPNRDVPTSVTVSGKEYVIEGGTAFNKLYSGGVFEYGDSITLLLGRDNKIADVISPSATADGVVGYLTQTGTKDYSSGELATYTNYYINIVTPDGNSYEYITDKDYKESKNAVVRLSFSDGYARIARATAPSNISGAFEWSGKKLGSSKLSSSVEILDVGTKYASEQAMYTRVYGQRLDGVRIDANSVLYAQKNSAGEIEKLILDNVTNDCFSYGIVIKAQKSGESTKYDYIADGRRYSTTGIMSVKAGDAVMIAGSLQNPEYMRSIEAVSNKIESISTDKLIADNTTYKISDKVEVYKRESVNHEYSMSDINEVITNADKYHITAYYDKPSSSGGRVRVIVVSDK